MRLCLVAFALGVVLAAGCAQPKAPALCVEAVRVYKELTEAGVAFEDARYDAVLAARSEEAGHATCKAAYMLRDDVIAQRAKTAADRVAPFLACEARCRDALTTCFMKDCGCGPPPVHVYPQTNGRAPRADQLPAASCLDRRSGTPRNEQCESGCGTTHQACLAACASAAPATPETARAVPETAAAPAPVAPPPQAAAPVTSGPAVGLRGPAPAPRVLVWEEHVQMQGNGTVGEGADQRTTGLVTIEEKTRGSVALLAYDAEARPTRAALQRDVETIIEANGERERERGAANGVRVVAERVGTGAWTWRSVDNALSKAQRDDLADAVIEDRGLFPTEPVAVGSTWTPSREAVALAFGAGHMTSFTLEVATLRLSSLEGTRAVIEGPIKWRGTSIDGHAQSFDVHERFVRDLTTGDTTERTSKGAFTDVLTTSDGTPLRMQGTLDSRMTLVEARAATAEDEPRTPKVKARSKKR